MIGSNDSSNPDRERRDQTENPEVNGQEDGRKRHPGESGHHYYRRRICQKLSQITHEQHLAYGTWVLAVGTLLLAFFAYFALRDGRQALEANQRAWIAPIAANFEAPVVAGQNAKIRVVYENTGREPAFDVAVRAQPIVTDAPSESDRWADIPVIRNSQCDDLSPIPAGPIVYPSRYTTNEQHFTLDKSFVTVDVIAGKKALYFEGCFVYNTPRRESGFCFVLIPDQTPTQQWLFSHCNANVAN